MCKRKHKCGMCCDEDATWKLKTSPNKIRVKYFCDKCLPRKVTSGYSFAYSKDGFIIDGGKSFYVTYDDCLDAFDATAKVLSLDEEFEVNDKFSEFFLQLQSVKMFGVVDYNKIMSKFGDYLVKHCSSIFSIDLVDKYRKFYVNFKKELYSKRFYI